MRLRVAAVGGETKTEGGVGTNENESRVEL